MTPPIVRQVTRDDARGIYTFTCAQSRLRWHMPIAALAKGRRLLKAWHPAREANWQIGLHGRSVNHAVMSVTEH